MSARDDYLFDRGGAPDPEVAALERLLAPLRHNGRALPAALLAALPTQRPRAAGRFRRALPWLAAAALLLLGAAALFWPRGDAPLAPGAAPRAIVTGDAGRSVLLGEVAALELAAGGELRFESWGDDAILVQLRRGALSARVAEAGNGTPAVRVATPFGEVVVDAPDPCAFRVTLAADDRTGELAVAAGNAHFVAPGRTVYVPAGASVRIAADGPGYPLYGDCDPSLRQVVAMAMDLAAKGRRAPDESLVRKFVDVCRTPRDTLVLWHLLGVDGVARRADIEQRLLELAGPPEPLGKTKLPSWPPEVWLRHLRAAAWR